MLLMIRDIYCCQRYDAIIAADTAAVRRVIADIAYYATLSDATMLRADG